MIYISIISLIFSIPIISSLKTKFNLLITENQGEFNKLLLYRRLENDFKKEDKQQTKLA